MSPGTDPVRVLVVEDNQRYGELIEHMLGSEFAADRVTTLGDAVANIQHGVGYGCILLDLLLPGTDRLEAVEALQSLAPDSPIVVLTGMENGSLALDAMKAGVQDYLYKGDIEPEPLRRSVLYAMERKRAQLAHQALHDPLTALPNRTLFRDRCSQALAGIGRTTTGVGVLFIDLDGFKLANDSMGHAAGDRLLVEVADRLQQAMRAGDSVSRFGGDEFTALSATLDHRHDAVEVAQRLTQIVGEPFDIAGREVTLTCSIGVTFTFDRDADPDVLIHEADMAMYRAKERGGACYEVFGHSLRARTARRREIESELRTALEEEQLRIAYQPQVELATGRMTGLEALARWEHPERGTIAAAEFIRVAEDTGMIHGLGRWVLAEACREFAAWRDTEALAPDVQLAVNLSPRQLARGDVVDATAAALAETGIDPSRLCLEVTEGAVVSHGARAGSVLKRLKSLGVAIAIDDFGVGYASLGYLERFPVDILKIDRSLVDGVARETRKQRVVATVMALADTLELSVLAEGIEVPEDAHKLMALGCRYGQGYLYARPAEGPVLLPM
ncbi:MAG TPA: EAL domain-containing protein [Thermoleophilaceae bacterium]|nr:EAL domain-containing protein [Thermoleophilaceae bacterium]